MPRLLEVLRMLGLDADIASSGRLAKIKGQKCAIYVAEAAWGSQYYTWCDDEETRTVELYRTAHEAIEAGLRRAGSGTSEEQRG
jgi:hypothetical protein